MTQLRMLRIRLTAFALVPGTEACAGAAGAPGWGGLRRRQK